MKNNINDGVESPGYVVHFFSVQIVRVYDLLINPMNL